MLKKQTLQETLQFRVHMVQVIAMLKFLHQLPIEHKDVEKKILERIERQANIRRLHPTLSKLFLQTLIHHSKILQHELFNALKSKSNSEIVANYNKFIMLLTINKPQYIMQWHQLTAPQTPLADKLQICRNLIWQATENSLQAMEELFNLTTKKYHQKIFWKFLL